MNQKRIKWLAAFCAVIFVVAGGYLAHYFVTLRQNSGVYETLQSTVLTPAAEPTATPSAPDATKAPEEPISQAPLISVDFDALAKTNADIYAWIDISGTEVSYPIAQHASDDAYYLNHTIEHAAGLPGSIYTERTDATDFSDFNTVIYGHNMANDTMFGSLNNYRDAGYFAEHNQIVIYTKTETRVYQIFAAVVYDNRYIPYRYDDANPEDCADFLNSIYRNENAADVIDDTLSVSAESQVITLSTCIGNQPNNRYLIVAVYQGEE